jgi:hypothetical protein
MTVEDLLEDLPPYEHGSRDIVGVLRAVVPELERIDAAKAQMRNDFFAHTTTQLALFEAFLGLSAADKSEGQRRAAVEAWMQKMAKGKTGLDWKAALTTLIGPNWSYEEHIPGDAGSPDPYVIRITLPFSSGSIKTSEAAALARAMTPAHIDLEFTYDVGFIVGISEMGDIL